jgi:hypothetical protein
MVKIIARYGFYLFISIMTYMGLCDFARVHPNWAGGVTIIVMIAGLILASENHKKEGNK